MCQPMWKEDNKTKKENMERYHKPRTGQRERKVARKETL